MSAFTESQVKDLADGLRAAANADDDPQGTPDEVWRQVTRYALAHAGIELSDEQFEKAWRTAWRRAFMGGNYTLDARAILEAAGVVTEEPECCASCAKAKALGFTPSRVPVKSDTI